MSINSKLCHVNYVLTFTHDNEHTTTTAHTSVVRPDYRGDNSLWWYCVVSGNIILPVYLSGVGVTLHPLGLSCCNDL